VPTVETITYKCKKKRGQRQATLENLPTESIEYRLSDEEQVSSCCGGKVHEMSTEVRQEVVIIPAQAKIVKQVRYDYSYRHCEHNEIETSIMTAPGPKSVYPKSLASPSSMAYIMNQKYVDGIPLYRQEQKLKRYLTF